MTTVDKEVRRALSAIASTGWDGTVWRIARQGRDPLAPNIHGARWNPPGVAALYTSLERETAVAEWRFRISQEPQSPSKPFALYRVHTRLDAVVDLRARDTLETLGVKSEHLTQQDSPACQLVGQVADWMHQDGLLVPSARTETGSNLVILKAQCNPENVSDAEFEEIVNVDDTDPRSS